MKNIYKLFGLLVITLTLAGCSSSSKTDSVDPDKLVQCLSDKGVIMYGTNTCRYCLEQKKLFGDSFEKINFVNCLDNPNQCTLAGVRGIPYRYIDYSERLEGLQSLETLAKEVGCEVSSAS